MAKPTRFTPTKTPQGWRLNIPPRFSDSGKRERHFYRTRDEATEAAAKLKSNREQFGNQARAISPSLAEQAIAAEVLLRPFGLGLLEGVQRLVAAEQRLRASATVRDACTAFRTAKSKLSAKQKTAYRLRCDKLIAEFGDRMIATIDGEELQSHLEETTGGPAAFNQNVRLVRAIWRWCAKPPRKWCDEEAILHLELEDAVAGEIKVLTAAEASRLMAAAEEHYPESAVAFAMELFAGIRPIEITRLTPHDVTSDGVSVPAASDRKNSRRRFVQMTEPLAAWLEAYPIKDIVAPSDWTRKRKAVRRLAGFRVWSDMVEPNSAPPDLPAWPFNGLRHSAATLAVGMGKPIEQLVFEHGHTGGLEMLRRQYVGVMPKREALAIWAIRPHGEVAPDILAVVA